jgi:[ribosomal protein S5]-alanine N-acetyltransferase
VELAYALVAEYWNRGPAPEMARAVTDLAFERLGLTNVVCFTLPTNLASRRVMEKVGFAFERNLVHAGLPLVLCCAIAATHASLTLMVRQVTNGWREGR